MVVVNLFGAPCSGKSTGAAFVFSKLKMHGVRAELVTEFAKDMVWEDNRKAFQNQPYIFGEQYFRLSRLEDSGVDVVVTDSPLILSSFYNRDERIMRPFDDCVTQIFHTYNNINAFIERNVSTQYDPVGRIHSREESEEIESSLRVFLDTRGVFPMRHYAGNEIGYSQLFYDVLKEVLRS